MTDFSAIAPTAIRRSVSKTPRSGIRASLAGIADLLGDALKMAYVDPYTSHRRRPQVVPDDDLEGRNPSW